MIQLKAMIDNVLRSTFSRMIEVDTREWPPKCTVFTYQPQRPKITGRTDKTSYAAPQKRNER